MNSSEKFWDRAASTYDQEEKRDEQIYVKLIEKTKQYLKSSDTVLDYGCGTGLIANELAGHVKMIHAIDISSKMIEIARQKAAERKIENIEYAQATISNPQFKPGSFDVILVFYLLHLLEDTQLVMPRIHELLKPGGLVISVTPCLGEELTFLKVFLSLGSKLGIIPRLKSYKISELEASFAPGNFEIIASECLHPKGQQCFIVARKASGFA